MTAINSNRAIRGPVTAVPVVAGKGVRLVADTENNRWVVEADETVLWEGIQELTVNTEITLSETYKNFERIRFECSRTGLKRVSEFNTYDDGVHNAVTLLDSQVDASNVLIIDSVNLSLSNAVKPKVAGVGRKSFSASTFNSSTSSPQTLIKVVGINRIASN